jgi:iron complex transport system ATP-binding protein
MSSANLFDIDQLSFAYGTTQVLNDLSLSLEPGHFYGIVGPNGCGKTTFIDLLTGCKAPAAGSIHYLGKPLAAYNKRELAQQLALVPQEFDIGFGFTVEETVMMGRHPYIDRFGAASSLDWQKVEDAMALIGINDLAGRPINSLSGGQKQRVIVARALTQDTPVLFFDEATSNLDIKYTLQIFNIARKLVQESRRTVIAVIHNLNLAAAFCDQLLFMKNGTLFLTGATNEIMTARTIHNVFDVHAEVIWNSYCNTYQVNYQYW